MEITKLIRRFLDRIHRHTVQAAEGPAFLSQQVPTRTGFGHVLGGLTFFLFMLCAGSGIFLAFHYVPTPDRAYDSIRHIDQALPLGQMIRGLHFWASNALALILGLHILRVFVWGAYKRPRRMIWALGVMLLLVVMAESITGYLLPWSQNGYWASVVRIHIVGRIPFIGSFIKRLVLDGDTIGALTLSRFFTLHILLLPIVLLLLATLHIAQVRIKGITPPFERVGDEGGGIKQPFVTSRLALAAFLGFAICTTLAWRIGAPLQPRANTHMACQAYPSWSWMYLCEWGRLLPSEWAVIGVVIAPGLGLLAMLALPYLDRNPERKISKRPVAMLLALSGLLTVTGLEIAGFMQQRTPREIRLTHDKPQGQHEFFTGRCADCHSASDVGDTGGHNPLAVSPKQDSRVGPDQATGQDSNVRKTSCIHEEPPSHFADWIQRHGSASRVSGAECSTCHPTSRCIQCHQTHCPVSHSDPDWLKIHGANTESDRSCALCHGRDSCSDCHGGIRMPHPKDWIGSHKRNGATFDRAGSCMSCHEDISCEKCHGPITDLRKGE